ncbi:FO synthase subunit 2 [Porphyridium purpureum]|uniref:FO synthase subunit 2 n=1 Tax=Porphyridium purpureum TaxID=35688 RepID=A0A5J4YUD2_PORPP|nr:FO synthase subunit 2 [Porphyridium purpureum]|eukprot:POR2374..scf227_4
MAGARRGLESLLRLPSVSSTVKNALDSVLSGGIISSPEVVDRLLNAGPDEYEAICVAADELRKAQVGDAVSFVVNRNINFTNVCVKRCGFCAFSRDAKKSDEGYVLPIKEVVRRASEAKALGATEVCIQAGLLPHMDGVKYLHLVAAIKEAEPSLHIHAYSPEEILYGSKLMDLPVSEYLKHMKGAGLGSLPGTSAEILDKEVRNLISPGRISVDNWLEVIRTAHGLGIPTTSTMMYGHAEKMSHVARHLLLLQQTQRETQGFTEFVPLSFVSEHAPMAQPGFRGPRAKPVTVRKGPSRVERILVHAVSRLVLGRFIPNLQVSWVKEGLEDAKSILECGANDLGGTLMNESISTAAGSRFGQLQTPSQLKAAIRELRRVPVERSTTYRVLRRFDVDPAADEREATGAAQSPLDQVQDHDERFGSYATLIHDERFKYDNDFSTRLT